MPFGKIAKADNNIYWPPDEIIAMSVVGFKEVAKEALTLEIDDQFSIKVASLAGIFILMYIPVKVSHHSGQTEPPDKRRTDIL